METRFEHSAGGVVVRASDGSFDVALAARRTRRGELVWGLPKGGVERDESAEVAAVREVLEETGLVAELRKPLGAALAVLLQCGAPDASAQTSAVAVRLVSQSAWNGPTRPLSLSFDATNTGTSALTNLSVVVTVLAPATSRSVYELSLRTDAT